MKKEQELFLLPPVSKEVSKRQIKKEITEKLNAIIEEGKTDEVGIYAMLRYVQEVCAVALENENLRDCIETAVMHGQGEVKYQGMVITQVNMADKLDFSNDSKWCELDSKVTKLSEPVQDAIANRKAREFFLKSITSNGRIVDADTGELLMMPKVTRAGAKSIRCNF